MPADQTMPDGLLGALFALEGIKDSVTILNGPTGCKYYPASLSDAMFQRQVSFNPLQHVGEFYFGQPRIPCTYMDSQDYIMGSEPKLRRVFDLVQGLNPSMIGIINSPGASLIGEGLRVESTRVPVVKMESPGYSHSISEGFQNGVQSIMESISLEPMSPADKRVNLLGLSIWHLGWMDSIEDLKGILELCGIQLSAVVGAGWTLEEARDSASASLNVVVDDDFSSSISRWYEKELGVPSLKAEGGSPLGFDNLEGWISAVCGELDANPEPALRRIRYCRHEAYREISRLNAATGLPKGRTFSLSGHASLLLPVLKLMHSYLGMVPLSIKVKHGCREQLDDYLAQNGLSDIGEDVMETAVDLALADGNTIAALMAKGLICNGVDILHPGLRSVHLRPRPILGLQGTMGILDEILNALSR